MARQIRKKSGTVKAFLLQSQGIANPLMIQSLEKVRRNEVLILPRLLSRQARQIRQKTKQQTGIKDKSLHHQ